MNQKLMTPQVTPFFDADSHTISYIVQDPSSSACAVIDPVLEFDYSSSGYLAKYTTKIRTSSEMVRSSTCYSKTMMNTV